MTHHQFGMTRWEPFRNLERVLDRRWRWFDWPRYYWHEPSIEEHAYFAPLEVFDRDGQTVVKLEVPGVAMEDIDISMSDGMLTIRGEKKQEKEVVCYVSYYPHWQDPNEPEPNQIYRYANEVNDLKVPVLIFFGEHDQYGRIRSTFEGIKALEEKGRNPKLIVYPGVGRGFDFRPPKVRTFADDLASKDAMRRAEIFIRHHLAN